MGITEGITATGEEKLEGSYSPACKGARSPEGSEFPFTNPSPLAILPPVPTDPITTTGEVLRKFSENAFKVSLPNGKEIIAHPARDIAERIGEVVPGARVALEMTPFDFEKGRIVEIV